MRHLPGLSFLLGVASALSAQHVVEVEPNNSPAQAQPVWTTAQIDCTLVAGEQDWFAFTLPGPRKVSMFTSAPGTGSLDTVLELFDATGATVLAFSDDARGALSDISVNLAAGSYLLMVRGFTATTSGTYWLDLAETFPEIYTDVESEPNDTLATAKVLPQSPCRVDIDAQLSGPTDEDWYRLTLSAPRSGVWFLIDEGDAPWITQHRYEARDSLGNLLPAATMGANAGDNSATAQRTSQIRCWPAGVYHIVVKNRTTYTTSPLNKVPIGRYRLKCLVIPMNVPPQGVPATALESPEPNSGVATASPITPGQRGLGDIAPAAPQDEDWWGPITTVGPSTLMVQTAPGSSSALSDSTIRLLDGNGTVLSTATTGNLLDGSAHARLTVTLNFDAPQTYYVQVTGNPSANVGNYAIEIGLVGCTPYAVAAMGKKEGNLLCVGSAAGVRVEFNTPGARELPVLGSLFTRTVSLAPPGTLVLLLQGFTDQIANGSIPLPLDLGSLGAPGCFLEVDPLLVSAYFSNGSGRAVMDLLVPASGALLGVVVHEQVAVFDPPANQLGLTMTNALWLRFGNRSY